MNENMIMVINIRGEQVRRSKYQYAYSYDPFVVWKGDFENTDSRVYSDRLWQWDSEKFNTCCIEVWGNKGQYFDNRSCSEIERFLSLYFNKEVELTGIEEGCNVSSGFPFWVFYYRE